MDLNQRLHRLICKASNGVYKKYQEKKYGIRVCTGKLADTDIKELGQDIELLKYLACSKDNCCDFEKLIENLT